MRILFVVQRYGVEVGGGAEQHCRWLAEGLAARGHDVVVATSRALDYMTWDDHYREDDEMLAGVRIRRFGVTRPRDVAAFNELSQRIDFLGGSHSLELEDEWLLAQGPLVNGMREWLDQNCESFDVIVPFTYLYRTSQIAIEVCSGRTPIWMHATAHDEPPFHLRRILELLGRVDGFLCSTPEEADLIRESVATSATTEVVGVGVSLDCPARLEETMRKYDIPLLPYCLILGRVDESKGVLEGIRFFREFKLQTQSPLRLIVVGQNVANLASDSEVTITGFVDGDELAALLFGAEFLVQPSYFESFSLALCESWLAGTPTLANGNCAPVAGQTSRSGGGLLYRTQNEFVSQAHLLHRSPLLRRKLSIAGQKFVRETFESSVVISRIERLLLGVSASM
jgi:glycosyltransferase involved in cell wall biosynthesis